MGKNIDLVIDKCKVLLPDHNIASQQAILINDGKIDDIISNKDLDSEKYTWNDYLDGKGKLALPGLIDGHIHICQQLLRGRTADEYPMVWARILVPFESSLTAEDVFVSAKLCALEMIKSGTTSFAESGGLHMAAAVEGIQKSGLRGTIARSVMDQGKFINESMKETKEESIAKTEELIKEYDGSANGKINIWFALRQVMTCSPELIKLTAKKAEEHNTGIHIHLEEHRDEVSFCLENYQQRPAEFLASMGLLGNNVLAAHSVLMTDSEIDLIAEKGVSAVHCPRSNLGSHWFPKTPSLLNAGVNVGLGSDGSAGSKMDIFQEMKILRSAISAYYGIPIFDPRSLTTNAVLKMATEGGATALNKENILGKLKPGYLADITMIDIDQPHLFPNHNLVNTVVDAADGGDVCDLIVDCTIVMKDREVLTLDEEKIMHQAKNHLQEISKKANI